MKKFIYLCGMILLSVNVIAQIGNNRQLDDSLYCDNRIKELTVNYHSTNIPITLGWRYDSIYSDEFSNPPIDTRKWVIRDRKWQSPKKQIGYVNSYDNVHIENGKLYLNITTNDDSIVCNCPWDTTNLKYHAPELLSGWIQSTDTTKIRYGYIETKCYLPKNHNYWPCFWTTGRYKTNNYDDYDEVDVFERTHDNGTDYPNIVRQNCHNGLGCNYTLPSEVSQILTFQDSITGRSSVFGVEILPEEVVFYINGHVSSHLVFSDDLNKFNPWNTITCTDIEEMIPMELVLSLTCDWDQTTIPLPHESSWFEYVRSYKLERGNIDTYHPTVYSVSNESTKVYPHVILGGIGYTASVNNPSAVWAEQDILFDKGFELAANTPFSARVISVPDAEHSELYIQNCH